MRGEIVHVVETCAAFPAQWEARTADGRELLLRYRWGIGTVHDDSGDNLTFLTGFTWCDCLEISSALHRSGCQAGTISLLRFAERAGLRLSPTITGVTVDGTEWAAKRTPGSPPDQ